MKNSDFEWLTDEFMLYYRSTQLREKTICRHIYAQRLGCKSLFVPHPCGGFSSLSIYIIP